MSVLARRRLAWLLMHDGQFSQAQEEIRRVLEIDPQGDSLYYASQLEILAGRPREALAAIPPDANKKGRTSRERWPSTRSAMPQSRSAQLDFLLTHHANVWGYQIAEVYAWRGEKDKAFEWLERAYRQHDGGLTYLTYDRWLTKLRGDPRFTALLQKLKLAS